MTDKNITLEQVRERLSGWYGGSEACLDTKACGELGSMIDAITLHIEQQATIDLAAIREVIARVASDNQKSALTLGMEGLRGQCIETAKELHKLAQAIGGKP